MKRALLWLPRWLASKWRAADERAASALERPEDKR